MRPPVSMSVSSSADPQKLEAQNLEAQNLQPRGLYIVGNDTVLAHIQALCEAIASRSSQPTAVQSPALNPFPICIIPFDHDCTQIQAWIATQPHLTLFQDQTSLLKWETFYAAVWTSQAVIDRLSQRYATHHGDVHYARKFCAFDGPFERFVVYDAMRGGQQADESGPCLDFAQVDPNQIFTQLDRYDLAVEDWEWLKPEPGATLDLAYSADALGCVEERVRDRLHGAHWFGARASLFPPDVLTGLCQNLMEGGELRWINPLRWWDEAALFNYMTLRTEARVWNQAKIKLLVNPFLELERALCATTSRATTSRATTSRAITSRAITSRAITSRATSSHATRHITSDHATVSRATASG